MDLDGQHGSLVIKPHVLDVIVAIRMSFQVIGFVVFIWRRAAQLLSPQNDIDSNHVDARIYLVNAAIGYVLVSQLYDMIPRVAEP